MKKKALWITSFVLICLVLVLGFVYSQTKKYQNCSEVLKNYSGKHACILTDQGAMVFELFTDAAPNSVDRFTKLANDSKFYDGLEVYRVAKDFVVQMGIQDIQGENYEIKNVSEDLSKKFKLTEDKFDTEANFEKLGLTKEEKEVLQKEGYKSNDKLNTREFEYGSLSFANQQKPNTNSTELFVITAKEKTHPSVLSLKGKFTNMGKIVSGQDILDKINSKKVVGDRVEEEIKILEVRVN